MKVRSGHIVFSNDTEFKDLVPIYKELYMKFLQETDQVAAEPEELDVMIKVNMLDLRRNRKPQGFNRIGNMRLIFPITDDNMVQFYIYGQSKSEDIARVTDSISRFLDKKGFSHEVHWDRMLWRRAEIFKQSIRRRREQDGIEKSAEPNGTIVTRA